MALRKRYKDRIESPDKDGPPVSTPPKPEVSAMAKAGDVPTSPAPDAPKPPEQSATEPSPAEQAGHTEMLKRLREMEKAETLQSEATERQRPQLAAEPQPAKDIIANSGLPQQVQDWLRQQAAVGRNYISDPLLNAKLQKLHHVAEYQAGETFTPAYLDKLDILLGHKQEQPTPTRNAAPAPQQQRRVAPPVSAPVHREPQSFSSGKPVSYRAPLTQAERDVANGVGISAEEYSRQKEKMERLKASGAIQS
jgi:hypothetical protein